MSYTNGLDKPTDYFETKLYTGNGGTNNITGLSFAPDWVWLKERSGSGDHRLFDTVRGATNDLMSNNNEAEADSNTSLTSFNSDGFTLGNEGGVNNNSDTFVSWNWLAGGSASSNSNGTETSTVSANTTAGFSIMTYAGTTAVDTYGHGLSQKPEMIFIKRRTLSGQWVVYNKTIGATHNLHLDSTDASSAYQYYFNNTEPTNSVITLSDDGEVNKASSNYVAYVFHSVQGYSKIGSYIGNGSATDGTFVYTGMKPAFVLLKMSSGTGSWCIYDNKRDTFNPASKRLVPNVTNAEADTSTQAIDFLSNGFKLKSNNTDQNGSGSTYIYLAFAESPFVNSKGVPNNAR